VGIFWLTLHKRVTQVLKLIVCENISTQVNIQGCW